MACQKYSISDVELIEQFAIADSRERFWTYRQYINPRMKIGWWQRAIASHLQQFYDDLVSGLRPILIIQAPPQHGKSEQIVDFISWLAGKNPDIRTIYASFSERLGVRANLKLQRIYDSQKYRAIFPGTKLNESNVVTISGQFLRNREVLEYVGRTGYFRNTTVRGSVTGESLDLGVIDDPVKGREEANSETVRNKTWDWFTDDYYSRFSDHGGLLCIMTRWHEDDLVGRLIADKPNAKLLSYPALADNCELMPDDPREPGSLEPLFPEHKSKSFLIERRSIMLPPSWESLYQQNPIPRGSCWFPAEKIVPGVPAKMVKMVRYWDKAGTDGAGCYTAGVLMGVDAQGVYWILDVVRGQWEATKRESIIKQTAELDGRQVVVWVEQEPGSSGKESADATIKRLSGFVCKADKVSGDKETRAEPLASQCEAGNVRIKIAPWNRDFIDEASKFPSGKYKDQIDAASGAFNKLTAARTAGVLTRSSR